MQRRCRELAAIAAEIDRIRSLRLDALRRQLKPAGPDTTRWAGAGRACIAEQAAEIARLRLRKPAAESARKPTTKPANPDSEVARLKATIVDLRRGLKHFQKRKDASFLRAAT